MNEAVLLSIGGEVEQPLALTASRLTELADGELVADLRCHEGWTRPGIHWRGVRVGALLALACARADGRHVTIACGHYAMVLTREHAEDDGALLALECDGKPLARDQGLPRLVGPSDWDCFVSVKSVDRIEVTREPGRATAAAIALARIGR